MKNKILIGFLIVILIGMSVTIGILLAKINNKNSNIVTSTNLKTQQINNQSVNVINGFNVSHLTKEEFEML